MAEIIEIHPTHPQERLVLEVVESIRRGAVVVYPTDSGYALGCHLGEKGAMERIRRIRELDKHHNFTLMCRDLSELAVYARYDNTLFRTLKALTPGPYTFIFQATKEVPKRLQNPKRKTIGIRVPNHPISLAILEKLDEPMMSVTLIMPGDDRPLSDQDEIQEHLDRQVDLIVQGGNCGIEPTSVIDMSEKPLRVLRVGQGDVSLF